MKKVFYILLLSFVTSLSITSCTEDEVAPSAEASNGGGEASEKTKP